MAKEPLSEHRQRWDFAASPEPEGTDAAKSQRPIFVVQEHRASAHPL